MGWAARAKVSSGNPEQVSTTRGRFIRQDGVDRQLEVVGMARIKFADREYAMNPSGQLRRLRPGGSITEEEKANLPKEVWSALAKSLDRRVGQSSSTPEGQTPGGSSDGD